MLIILLAGRVDRKSISKRVSLRLRLRRNMDDSKREKRKERKEKIYRERITL